MSLNDHLSRVTVTGNFKRPTEKQIGPIYGFSSLAGILVLLRMGFTWLPMLPPGRWSLTPPFHPYHKSGGIFLLHWPWGHPHRTLSGILPCEARTFLTCQMAAAIICPTY